jgi:hypothetical protein
MLEGWLTGRTVARAWWARGGLAAKRFGGATNGPPIPGGWLTG